MRLFKILWKSEKKAGTWIAFEAHQLWHPLMFTFSRNGYAKQWFMNMNVFPIAIQKNNSEFKIGLSLIFFFIGINFHLNFSSKVRDIRKNDVSITFIPFSDYEFSLRSKY